jgi:formate hydrogenlyase transcriptional activator
MTINNDSSSSLEERLQFETLLADLSTRFVNLPSDKIDMEIETVLQRITEALNIDRCSVAQFTEDRNKLHVTHAFSVPGVPPMPDLVLNEQQPWYSRKLYRCESIVMKSIGDLPEEAGVERAHCLQQGIKSSALIPLAVGGSFLGVVGFASLKSVRQWPDALVQRLNMLGVVFANALMRKTKEQELFKAFSQIQNLKDQLEAENTYLREEINLQYLHEEFIGQSDSIKSVLRQAEQVAKLDTTVLILGETGTGKELLAQAIHKLSRRKDYPKVTVNCAALPANLIESELFGHERGAFTGAETKRVGRFELADGASLFLDEIGELPLDMQVKLLRVLQEKQFERLGGQKTITTDVRIIAATNRNLAQAVYNGEFRKDLYYRLNVFPITIPPLRDRRADIPPLVWFFVRNFCEKMDKHINSISRSSMNGLCNYSWPGNVRELQNVIERAIIITTGSTLQIELPGNQISTRGQVRTLEEVQKEYILDTLKTTKWCIRGKNGAAGILGLKPTTLESRMAKFGIQRPAKS